MLEFEDVTFDFTLQNEFPPSTSIKDKSKKFGGKENAKKTPRCHFIRRGWASKNVLSRTYSCFNLPAFNNELNDSDDEFNFDQVLLEPFEEGSDSEVEESLEQAVRNINEKSVFSCILIVLIKVYYRTVNQNKRMSNPFWQNILKLSMTSFAIIFRVRASSNH